MVYQLTECVLLGKHPEIAHQRRVNSADFHHRDMIFEKQNPYSFHSDQKRKNVGVFKGDFQVTALMWLAVAHLIPKGCLDRTVLTVTRFLICSLRASNIRSLVEGKHEKVPR